MATSLLRAARALVLFVILVLAVPSFGQYPFPLYPSAFDYSKFPPIHHAVPLHSQDTMAWCWVAAAKMICEYHGRRPVPSQCEMLQMHYGAPCCESPWLCIRTGQITEIQELITRFGGKFTTITPPADGFALYNELRRGPIIMQTRQGAGHAIVATGMRVVPSPLGPMGRVSINDPFFGQYEVDFPDLLQAWIAALVVY